MIEIYNKRINPVYIESIEANVIVESHDIKGKIVISMASGKIHEIWYVKSDVPNILKQIQEYKELNNKLDSLHVRDIVFNYFKSERCYDDFHAFLKEKVDELLETMDNNNVE